MNKLLTLFILAFVAVGCRGAAAKEEKPGISVSILPLAYFVDRVSGGDFEVTVIVPPGASPETYEPTPSQMKDVARSEAFFQIGLIDFEHHLADGIQAGNPELRVVSLSEGLDLLEGDCGHDHGGVSRPHAHGIDPHVWLSPDCVKAMVGKIAGSLSEIRPDSAFKYQKNQFDIISSIDSLDLFINQSFSQIGNRSFLIYHPFLSYYARDYSLRQLPVELEGKEPSAAYLKELVEMAKTDELTTIFYQGQFSQSTVEALVREANLKMVALDPLAYEWIDNMVRITDLLKESFE